MWCFLHWDISSSDIRPRHIVFVFYFSCNYSGICGQAVCPIHCEAFKAGDEKSSHGAHAVWGPLSALRGSVSWLRMESSDPLSLGMTAPGGQRSPGWHRGESADPSAHSGLVSDKDITFGVTAGVVKHARMFKCKSLIEMMPLTKMLNVDQLTDLQHYDPLIILRYTINKQKKWENISGC